MSIEFRRFIVCPVCGKEDREMSDYPRGLDHDGDVAITHCAFCDAPLVVTVSVSYSFFSTLAASPGAADGSGGP